MKFESQLQSLLDDSYIVKLEEAYDFQNHGWMFLELMENDLSAIFSKNYGDLSEDFVRWTLYKVALAIQHLHS